MDRLEYIFEEFLGVYDANKKPLYARYHNVERIVSRLMGEGE